MTDEHGDSPNDVRRQLCKSLCRLHIHSPTDQHCAECAQPDSCGSLADEVLNYVNDQRRYISNLSVYDYSIS